MTWLKSIKEQFLVVTSEQADSSNEKDNHLDHYRRHKLIMSRDFKQDSCRHPTRSILGPVNSSKVSKVAQRYRGRKRKHQQHLTSGVSADVPDTGEMAHAPTQEQRQRADTESRNDIAERKRGKGTRKWRKSVLSPVRPSRVSKPARMNRRHQKLNILCDASQSVENATDNPYTLRPRSERLPKLKEAELYVKDIRSPPTADRGRNKQETTLGMSSAPSTSWKLTQQSVSTNILLRRSKRILKKPEKFCPGYT